MRSPGAISRVYALCFLSSLLHAFQWIDVSVDLLEILPYVVNTVYRIYKLLSTDFLKTFKKLSRKFIERNRFSRSRAIIALSIDLFREYHAFNRTSRKNFNEVWFFSFDCIYSIESIYHCWYISSIECPTAFMRLYSRASMLLYGLYHADDCTIHVDCGLYSFTFRPFPLW